MVIPLDTNLLMVNPLKSIVLLLLTLFFFSEKCQQEKDNGNVQLTPVQYQILVDLFKQSQNNVETSNVGQAQVNQIESFSADYSHKVVDPSSTSKLLSCNNLQYLKSCWILDSGATDHICISLANFVSYKCIKPVLINLPNGNKVFANYSGTVVLNCKLHLSNVLYVPQFSFNLISVSKISSNLNCRLIFSSNECVI